MTDLDAYQCGDYFYFNSHARVGRDSPTMAIPSDSANFNSHARVGRDLRRLYCLPADANFNSHARVGRDIFTSAPSSLCNAISTHTPAWGVTHHLDAALILLVNFNSHARVGRDLFHCFFDQFCQISTHTPAWGVTMYLAKKLIWTQFQLTRPRGA